MAFEKWGRTQKRSLMGPLMLTSLVDAFTILVIFLLLNVSQSENFLIQSKDILLPMAKNWAELERSSIIRIEKQGIFLGDEWVDQNDLVAKLVTLKQKGLEFEKLYGIKEPGIIIQADKALDYDQLNPIIRALAQTGFSDIQFAVMQK